MQKCFVSEANQSIPIQVVTTQHYAEWFEAQSDRAKAWLTSTQYKAEAGVSRVVPGEDGKVELVVCAIASVDNWWGVGSLPLALPEGSYHFVNTGADVINYALAWGLGAYQFTRYKKALRVPATLVLPTEMADYVINMVESIYLVRDCVNTPTENMGPTELADVTRELAAEFGAEYSDVVGDELLKQNYGAIHAVGRASDDEPRLLDLRWGNEAHPKLTLVGKGVCFDTGGLDIKASQYMLLMKKDMGGAAHVLGLARMIMHAKLPVRLRVLIPAVENAISGSAYRPGDVITSRKGLTIEIGNTDAEGRVVLADALTEAASENPDLLIDIATLTGAARVALGTDLPVVFSNNEDVVNAAIASGNQLLDPMWRLPLYAPYREYINSTIADINNNASEPYGGAITAALFLKEFVPDTIPWMHFDLMAYNTRQRPGRPQGGEAMALRALYKLIEARYQTK